MKLRIFRDMLLALTIASVIYTVHIITLKITVLNSSIARLEKNVNDRSADITELKSTIKVLSERVREKHSKKTTTQLATELSEFIKEQSNEEIKQA